MPTDIGQKIADAAEPAGEIAHAPPCREPAAPTIPSVAATATDPIVSIVIPHLDAPCLADCLSSIFACGARRPFEVILVADGSPAGDVQKAAARHPELRVVALSRSQGFARACNAGAGAAQGRYLLFLNDDTTVTPGWLDELVDFVESDPAIGIAGPKLLYPQTGAIQHCGTVVDHDGHGSHLNRHVPGDNDVVNRPRYFRAITGACIILERELFGNLGGFDIHYHRSGGCEDTDLCFKVLEQGRRVAYCPASTVYHHEGISRGLRDALHPEEVYNRKLLQQRWAKYLKPDIGEYAVLAEIEAQEGRQWHWLAEVPVDLLGRKCAELAGQRDAAAGERDAARTERDAARAEAERLARRAAELAAQIDRANRQLAQLQEQHAQTIEAARAEREGREAALAERDTLAQQAATAARGRDAIAAALWRELAERRRQEELCQAIARERDAVAAALLHESRTAAVLAAAHNRRLAVRLGRSLRGLMPRRRRR